jgi:hypothetical protein
LQRINPFIVLSSTKDGSPPGVVPLDFTVLENVLDPVVSFRASFKTFDDVDPEVDGKIHCFLAIWIMPHLLNK